MNGCRIARVRHKATGRTVEVIRQHHRNEVASKFMEYASAVTDILPRDMAGFFLVAMDKEGRYSAGSFVDPKLPFGTTLFATMLGEIIRREVITEADIASFCIRHGWLKEG